jgi:hypothetical protein
MASRISWRSIRRASLCCRSGRNPPWVRSSDACIGRGDAGRRRWLSLARQHGQNHVAAGDAGFQGFGTGRLGRGQFLDGKRRPAQRRVVRADDRLPSLGRGRRRVTRRRGAPDPRAGGQPAVSLATGGARELPSARRRRRAKHMPALGVEVADDVDVEERTGQHNAGHGNILEEYEPGRLRGPGPE